MKRPTIQIFIVLILTFLSGAIYVAWERDDTDSIFYIIGGGLGSLVFIIPLPLIVSLVMLAKNKVFPVRLFLNFTYILLAFVSVVMFTALFIDRFFLNT